MTLILLHLVGGFALGLGYFSALWWGVHRLTGGWAVAALAGRFAILAAVLAAVSLEGAWPLLAAAVGVIAGRFVVLRHVRATAA